MRHRVDGRKFGRETGHRKAMLRNLVKDLVKHESINTTQARAKEMRKLAERIITYGKKGSIHHRRLAFSVLQDKTLVKKVFDELAPKFQERSGGYTRIMKTGFRRGDCAPMAIIQFVEGNEETVDNNIKTDDLTK